MTNKKGSIFLPLFLIILLLLVLYKLDAITDYAASFISSASSVKAEAQNDYVLDNSYYYVQKVDDFVPYSYQDLMNIFYSILDDGYEAFTFYCPSEYTECLNDLDSLTSNQTVLTDIGNFVHPYNNFSNVKVVTDSLGEVDVVITKTYEDDRINAINEKLDTIFNEIFTDDMDIYDKILTIHDYVIDNTSYAVEDVDDSDNAYGLLFNGKAKCSGYADTMAIILSKLGVQNFKVASEKHVWNAALLDGTWYQIDLTWDDPVVENGTTITETIRHKFYMIDTSTLLSYDTDDHSFNQAVYYELKEN